MSAEELRSCSEYAVLPLCPFLLLLHRIYLKNLCPSMFEAGLLFQKDLLPSILLCSRYMCHAADKCQKPATKDYFRIFFSENEIRCHFVTLVLVIIYGL